MEKYYFETYQYLSWIELTVISYYYLGYDNISMDLYLKEDQSLSKDMKRFLSDVLNKQIKKPKKNGRPSQLNRDFKIWRDFENYKYNFQIDINPLTEQQAANKAAEKVASKLPISAEAVLKVVFKLTKLHELSKGKDLLDEVLENGFDAGEMKHDL